MSIANHWQPDDWELIALKEYRCRGLCILEKDRVREFCMFGTGYIKNTKIRTLICGLKEQKQQRLWSVPELKRTTALPHPLIWRESLTAGFKALIFTPGICFLLWAGALLVLCFQKVSLRCQTIVSVCLSLFLSVPPIASSQRQNSQVTFSSVYFIFQEWKLHSVYTAYHLYLFPPVWYIY